jgi:UDP-glucuronate 4-epimerase
MNILITGSAGFIGFHIAKKLLKNNNYKVFGIDNFNNYYDPKLKYQRNSILKLNKNYYFKKIDILDKNILIKFAKSKKITRIIHLAAQAGVRHSLKVPGDYLKSNIIGFFNVLEVARILKIKHLIFASTSSVYGLNENMPFKESNIADHPTQFYAATKRSNEIMAHSYSYLYDLPITACRFFTVYGPWGRPDMALFNFTDSIIKNKKINVYNYGNHSRDFTYCDDVANLVEKILLKIPKKNNKWNLKKPDPGSSICPFQILNVSSGTNVNLIDFIKEIERNLFQKSKRRYLSLQKGDIVNTLSSKLKIKKYLNLSKTTDYKEGIKNFVQWYLSHYKINV